MSDAATTASSPPTAPRAAADKREAILAAALRLIARSGLHNTPMSAVAREAGVAAGTLYLYFPSKEAMINALYLEVLADRTRAILGDPGSRPELADDGREALWRSWHAHARWHLDHPDASNLVVQCQRSGILTPETREAEQRIEEEGMIRLREGIERGLLRDMSRQIFWALAAGPIFVLSQLRESGELQVTDAVLRETFEGVCRSVLPADAAEPH
jgi:AcrR family transcriptional regulator